MARFGENLLPNHRHSPTILVVDDEPALRCLAEALLEELGYRAQLAESGRAAVQLLLQDPEAIAAVLLDMTMPGLGPEETLRLLHEISPALPVIILSGDSEAAVRQRFSAGAIAGYIAKPYTDTELEAVLAQALAQPVPDQPVPAGAFKLASLSKEEVAGLGHDYLTQCKRDLARWTGLLAAGDFHSLRLTGHRLKGSGGCFGFPELTELGRQLEHHAGMADAACCRQQVDALTNYLESF
jgi:CheY-like chemotaxis protein/HPt (histidine-containing phosphotransfer) domain-containing protein